MIFPMSAGLLVIAMLVGGQGTPSPHRWTPTNVVVASSAGVSLLVDWAQTRQALRRGWTETNPVLGPRPSSARLTLYNLVALPTVAGIGACLPTGWRTVWYAAVTLLETANITRNAALGLHIGF